MSHQGPSRPPPITHLAHHSNVSSSSSSSSWQRRKSPLPPTFAAFSPNTFGSMLLEESKNWRKVVEEAVSPESPKKSSQSPRLNQPLVVDRDQVQLKSNDKEKEQEASSEQTTCDAVNDEKHGSNKSARTTGEDMDMKSVDVGEEIAFVNQRERDRDDQRDVRKDDGEEDRDIGMVEPPQQQRQPQQLQQTERDIATESEHTACTVDASSDSDFESDFAYDDDFE